MKRTTLSSIAAFILLCSISNSVWAAEKVLVEKHVLSNGLTVLLYEDHTLPLVAVNIWYDVGSRDEQPGKTGFAHLFEHYMFEGSKNVPNGQFDKIISGMGGYNNASTSNDRTDYYDVAPSEGLEELLRLESDRMGFLKEAMTQASLDKQKGIVKNEKRQNYDNKAYGGLIPALSQTAWPEGHPYSHTTIGAMSDIDAASLQNVQDFHARYYRPDNAVLVVSGDHDSAQTLKLIEKWFGGLKAPENLPVARAQVSAVPAEFAQSRREKTVVDDKAQQPYILMAYRVPGLGKKDSEYIGVLADVLGGGRTSRLEQSLRYDQHLVLSIEAGNWGLQAQDLFLIEAMPAPGVKLETVVGAIEAEIRKLAEGGVKPEELGRTKAKLRTARVLALEKVDEIASALVEGQAVSGDPLMFEKQADAVMAMQPQEIQSAAQKYLVPSNSAVIYIIPKSGEPK